MTREPMDALPTITQPADAPAVPSLMSHELLRQTGLYAAGKPHSAKPSQNREPSRDQQAAARSPERGNHKATSSATSHVSTSDRATSTSDLDSYYPSSDETGIYHKATARYEESHGRADLRMKADGRIAVRIQLFNQRPFLIYSMMPACPNAAPEATEVDTAEHTIDIRGFKRRSLIEDFSWVQPARAVVNVALKTTSSCLTYTSIQ